MDRSKPTKSEVLFFIVMVLLVLVTFVAIAFGPCKPDVESRIRISIDTADRYHVDSATHQLMNWKGEIIK